MDAVSVRPSALAGTWYPGDADRLRISVESFFTRASSAKPAPPDKLFGLILPHAGHRYSGSTCAHGIAAIGARSFSKLVLIGPPHRTAVNGLAVPSWTEFETPLGRVPVDRDAVLKLSASGASVSNTPHSEEHCLEILLPFFQVALKNKFRIIPILAGRMDPPARRRWGDQLRTLRDPNTLIVASSDFVHYGADFGYEPDIGSDPRSGVRSIDEGAIAFIRNRDADGLLNYRAETGATICGIVPIALALEAAPPKCRADVLHYSQSADVTDDTDHMVSYASIGLYES